MNLDDLLGKLVALRLEVNLADGLGRFHHGVQVEHEGAAVHLRILLDRRENQAASIGQ